MPGYKDKIPDYCKKALALLNDAGYEAYVVGGAVRDLVMGKDPHDFDVTTSATPDEVIAVMDKAGVRYIPTGIKHGTVTVLTGSDNTEQVEITTFRVDGSYTDMRHPDKVDFTRSIDEDVRRRDFTVNSMYLDREGNITDITGGLDDISSGLIRAVGDGNRRFTEDALRIMRGLRLAAETGFKIEQDTMAAMVDNASLLDNIAGERISVELDRLVTAPYATGIIRQSVPVLKVIIPEIEDCQGFDQMTRYHDRDVLEHTLAVLDGIPLDENGKRDTSLALAALLHDIAKPKTFFVDSRGAGHMKGHPAEGAAIADRFLKSLKYSKAVHDEVVRLVAYHDYYIIPARTTVHRLLSNCGPGFFRKLIVLQRADIMAHSKLGQDRLVKLEETIRIADELDERGAVYKVSDLEISGKDILDLGVPAGTGVGKILDRLFDEYVDGRLPNVREALIKRATELS